MIAIGSTGSVKIDHVSYHGRQESRYTLDNPIAIKISLAALTLTTYVGLWRDCFSSEGFRVRYEKVWNMEDGLFP
ncbi:hypothetical protein GWI33_005156 [Rhynchophorus ferrugineus]|uniref:Uncharacterized protein n=1 Tax=Rhynchophorus ferrugineus TaxID=354439 RepID=A0A834MEV4_RHYFE|nr:hypothetical protein GWI33_005156 [Rhynchophorus ferrugineus]